MQRRRWTHEQRAEALRLLAEVGTGEAARRTGIPHGTIAAWGHRHGVTSPPVEAVAKLVAVAALTWEERRLRLKDKLGAAAERFVDRATDANSSRDIRDLMAAAAVGVDKAQLLAGAATARTETVATDARVAKLRDDLAARRQAKAS